MDKAVQFIKQVTEFVASNPNHPIVINYNNGEIGLGYIIRHWQEIQDANNSDQREGQSREDNPS